jgi:plasmid maintenance system antidote protein VapI
MQREDHVPQTSSPTALRELFRERGLTFDAAAVLAGVETSSISRIVNGQMGARPETIVRLARALGISAKRLQAMAAAARDGDQ